MSRRRLLIAGSNILPYDEEAVCIIADGDQYFDTGICGNETTEIEIDIAILFCAGSSSIISARKEGTDNQRYSLAIWTNGTKIALNDNGYDSGWIGNVTYGRHTIKIDGRKLYLDGNLLASSTSTSVFTMDTTYGLLRGREQNTWDTGTNRPLFAKLYGAKIKNNGVIVRNYKPVVKNGDGCLYDTVSGTLFYNNGSGRTGYESSSEAIYYNIYRLLRNGSLGNPSNAYRVAIKSTLPVGIYNHAELEIGKPNVSGYSYIWIVNPSISSSGSSSNTACNNDTGGGIGQYGDTSEGQPVPPISVSLPLYEDPNNQYWKTGKNSGLNAESFGVTFAESTNGTSTGQRKLRISEMKNYNIKLRLYV